MLNFLAFQSRLRGSSGPGIST